MAKFGSALQRYRDNMAAAIDVGLEAVGETGQTIMKEEPNIKDRIYEGRLEDSISWATSKKHSGIGPNAENGDGVQKPDESGIVYIGTQCPYAGVHNYGGIAGTFAYGKNGNPNTRAQLEAKIADWAKVRGFGVEENGEVSPSIVKKICDNIENGEQVAYPFFEPFVIEMKSAAPTVFGETFLGYMHRKKYINEEKV